MKRLYAKMNEDGTEFGDTEDRYEYERPTFKPEIKDNFKTPDGTAAQNNPESRSKLHGAVSAAGFGEISGSRFGARLYDLRHSTITRMYTRGLKDQLRRAMVGWRPASKMPNTYGHIREEHIISGLMDVYYRDAENGANNECMVVKRNVSLSVNRADGSDNSPIINFGI